MRFTHELTGARDVAFGLCVHRELHYAELE
jgi:hypothetical protein